MADKKIGEEFCEFLKTEGKTSENKLGETVSLTQGNYEKFLLSQGYTKDMLAKIKEVDGEVNTGINRFVADKLADKIKAMKKAGEDINENPPQVAVSIAMASGSHKVVGKAKVVHASSGLNAGKPPVTKYNSVFHSFKVNKSVDKVTVVESSEMIRKLYEDIK